MREALKYPAAAITLLVQGVGGVAFPVVMCQLLGFAGLLLSAVYGVRILVHLLDGYTRHPPMRKFMKLDASVWAGMTISSVLALQFPSPFLQLATFLAVTIGALFVNCRMVDVAAGSKGAVCRSSDHLPKRRRLRKLLDLLEPARDLIIVKPVRDLLSKTNTDTSALSEFAAAVIITLFFFVVLLVPASARDMIASIAEIDQPEAAVKRAATTALTTPRKVATPKITSASVKPTVTPTPGGSYETQCGKEVAPGDGAPEPQRRLLHADWLGPRGYGADEAGCAELAVPVPGHPDVWTATGVCTGGVFSLGVADADGHHTMLLQQAATFALRHAKEGRLLGASRRIDIGRGDLYLVHTSLGTYVLIRQKKNEGTPSRSTSGYSCANPRTNAAPYVILPPKAAKAWQLLSTHGAVWPARRTGGDPHDGPYRFTREPPAGKPVGALLCPFRRPCEVVTPSGGRQLAATLPPVTAKAMRTIVQRTR